MPEYRLILTPFDPDGKPSTTTRESGPFFSHDAAEQALIAPLGSGKSADGKIVG